MKQRTASVSKPESENRPGTLASNWSLPRELTTSSSREAGAPFSTVCTHRHEDPWESRTTSLMEPLGALPREVGDANSLKDMVGPCGLEPQTSTVSTTYKAVGDCQVLDNTQKSDTSRVGL